MRPDIKATFNECVHCGFCLPACPTYSVLGNEMDSPRGRLHLMRALEEGRIAPDAAVIRHLDLCLGCRACESECPSGVPYGHHLQAARARLRASAERPYGERLLESLILRTVSLPPWIQGAGARAMRLLGRLSSRSRRGRVEEPAARKGIAARIGAMIRLLGAQEPKPMSLPRVTAPSGAPRMRVGFLEGCVSRWVFGNVNRAGARLLARAGCEVLAPRGQRCCGALHAHAGDLEGARRLARANIRAFEACGSLDAIAVAAAGCGSAMKEYGALLEEDPEWRARARDFSARVRDALELLADIGAGQPAGHGHEVHEEVREDREKPSARERPPARERVAYHDACHLAHAQGIRSGPRTLLAAAPGIALVPLADADRCCGSAGIYNVLHPDEAAAILQEKLGRVKESGATVVAAANPGCLLQIAAGARAAGLAVRVAHPLELLDEGLDRKAPHD